MVAPTDLLRSQLQSLTLDDALTRFGPLGVAPIRAPVVPAPLRPLKEALERGEAEVAELTPPIVARVRVYNRSRDTLFAPAGTVLKGGGQNRVLLLPLLVPPGRVRDPYVHCVERQRWDPRGGDRFETTASAPVGFRLEVTGRLDAPDQEHTWSGVRASLTRRAVRSPTEDLLSGGAGPTRPTTGHGGAVLDAGRLRAWEWSGVEVAGSALLSDLVAGAATDAGAGGRNARLAPVERSTFTEAARRLADARDLGARRFEGELLRVAVGDGARIAHGWIWEGLLVQAFARPG